MHNLEAIVNDNQTLEANIMRLGWPDFDGAEQELQAFLRDAEMPYLLNYRAAIANGQMDGRYTAEWDSVRELPCGCGYGLYGITSDAVLPMDVRNQKSTISNDFVDAMRAQYRVNTPSGYHGWSDLEMLAAGVVMGDTPNSNPISAWWVEQIARELELRKERS